MTKAQAAERAESAAKLREWIKPGDTVYTVLRHVSSSGMSRSISPVILLEREPLDISGWVADVVDRSRDHRRGGVKCNGCGMDMGFDLVYSLAWALFGDGYALTHRWI